MGEYEPEDSRVVTQGDHQAPGEPPRTGPREDAARRQAEQREETEPGKDPRAESQPGYGNARGVDGQMEQDINTAALERGEPIGQRPAADEAGSAAGDPERLRRDADRPLGGE